MKITFDNQFFLFSAIITFISVIVDITRIFVSTLIG